MRVILRNSAPMDMGKLREVFDPYCEEYNRTEMEQKLKFLLEFEKKDSYLLNAKEKYIEFYKDRQDILATLPCGLVNLLKYYWQTRLPDDNIKPKMEQKRFVYTLERFLLEISCNHAYEFCKNTGELPTYFHYFELRHEPFGELSNSQKVAELCNIAVKGFAMSLEHVPRGLMTEKMCTSAVKKYRAEFEYVPEEFKTEKLCKWVANPFNY